MTNDNINESTICPSSIVTMWVLLEGKASAVGVDVDQKNYITRSFNLDRLKPILRETFEDLKNVKPEDTEFFTFNDRINPLPPDITLNSLSESTTATAPLNNSKLQIENELQFNEVIADITPNEKGKREVSISIQVTGNANTLNIVRVQLVYIFTRFSFIGRKAYGDWEIGEALNEFLHQRGSTMFDIRSFSMDDLPRPNPPIPKEAIAQLIAELKKRKCAFGIVNRNESTCREFTSPLMSTAVTHIQEEAKGLLLKAEEWIDGTKAYGPIDYSISIEEVLVLVQEVKKDDFEKGTAQNIAQIHSAIEVDPGDEEVPVVMYGIVTNALQWYFLRWAGSSDDPTVELSGPHICEFDSNNMEQYQVRGHDDDSKCIRIKRRRTS
ncbi:1495_t:CDS:2 [Racocetra fulgida]|uniref:1495_t:CDS:1 n=1 Tax=Racocetra fulgida TaxID=60492 RepID=A0A9N9I3Y4_9GLOM|nr:1495_t:CDS:2 [Racocetra fulgida]